MKATRLTYNKTNFFHFLLENTFNQVDDDDIFILFAAASEDDHSCPSLYVRDRLERNAHVATLFQQGKHSFLNYTK